MDGPTLLKFISAFVFVMSLMFMLSWGLKRLGLAGTSLLPNGSRRRLKIIETLPLDARRKLVIIRRDDREHLLVLGPTGETVVESSIPVLDAPGNVVELATVGAENLPQKDQKNAQA